MKFFSAGRLLFSLFLILYLPSSLSASEGLFGDLNQPPLLVNIDNPNFRKLVIAIPDFLVGPSHKTAEAMRFAKEGPKELARLLQFSAMFNVMSNDAYKNLESELEKKFTTSLKPLLNDPGMSTVEGIDLVQWKAIGVESLVVGEIEAEQNQLIFKFHLFDILRGKKIGGKKFSGIAPNDYISVMRRVADLIMEAYTGKRGIFRSKITFVGRRTKNAAKQIYVCDFDGSNAIQITSGNYIHISPHFSPDGRYVTYTSYENKNPDLFVYDLVEGKKRKLSAEKGINSGGKWAPNGKLIAFTGSIRADADIYTIEPDGANRKKLISGQGLDVDPAFSPNEKWIAWVSGRFGNPHIFVGSLVWDNATNPRVTSDLRLTYAGWYNATPSWSPESDKILFAGYDKDINRWDVFVINSDGKQLERLTLKKGNNESPSWAPNGQLIVFQSNRVDDQDVLGRYQLWIMNRDGSGQRHLPTGIYEAMTPDWSNALY
ncbi:MAG: PD40 domain-containing protein [Oligoflexales bacterium]|nr:PD40 domain-containing protein [Oligoflexales bacterium]